MAPLPSSGQRKWVFTALKTLGSIWEWHSNPKRKILEAIKEYKIAEKKCLRCFFLNFCFDFFYPFII